MNGDILYNNKNMNFKGILQTKNNNKLLVYYYDIFYKEHRLLILNPDMKQVQMIICINTLRVKPFILKDKSNNEIICLCNKKYLKTLNINTCKLSDKKNELYDRISISNKYSDGFITFQSEEGVSGRPVDITFKVINNEFDEKEFNVHYDIETFYEHDGVRYPYPHGRQVNNIFYINKGFYFIFSLGEVPPCYESFLKIGYMSLNDIKSGVKKLENVINVGHSYGKIYFEFLKYLYENIIEENHRKKYICTYRKQSIIKTIERYFF